MTDPVETTFSRAAFYEAARCSRLLADLLREHFLHFYYKNQRVDIGVDRYAQYMGNGHWPAGHHFDFGSVSLENDPQNCSSGAGANGSSAKFPARPPARYFQKRLWQVDYPASDVYREGIHEDHAIEIKAEIPKT